MQCNGTSVAEHGQPHLACNLHRNLHKWFSGSHTWPCQRSELLAHSLRLLVHGTVCCKEYNGHHTKQWHVWWWDSKCLWCAESIDLSFRFRNPHNLTGVSDMWIIMWRRYIHVLISQAIAHCLTSIVRLEMTIYTDKSNEVAHANFIDVLHSFKYLSS